jgi:hypothetical protein
VAHKTERFSVSFAEDELSIINKFCARTGISRNEYLRRSSLALARCANSDWKIPVKQAFEEVGTADDVLSLFKGKRASSAGAHLGVSGSGLEDLEV